MSDRDDEIKTATVQLLEYIPGEGERLKLKNLISYLKRRIERLKSELAASSDTIQQKDEQLDAIFLKEAYLHRCRAFKRSNPLHKDNVIEIVNDLRVDVAQLSHKLYTLHKSLEKL